MKRLWLILFFLLSPVMALAQGISSAQIIQFTLQPATQNPPPGSIYMYFDSVTGNLVCKNSSGATTACNGSAGTPSFSTITSGTNTSGTLTCGTGCTINTSGSGTITATNGITAGTQALPYFNSNGGTGTTTDDVFIDSSLEPGTDTLDAHLIAAISQCPTAGCTIDSRSETVFTLNNTVTFSKPIHWLAPYGDIAEASGKTVLATAAGVWLECDQIWACTLDGSNNGSVGTVALQASNTRLSDFEILGGLLNGQSGTEVQMGVAGTPLKKIIAEDNYVRDAGTTAISETDCIDCEARFNRTDWSGNAGVSINATVQGIHGSKALFNTVNDANMAYYVGIGDINVISQGGAGYLTNWVVQGNTVQNGNNGQTGTAALVCSYLLATPIPAFSTFETYSGCGEGIQVTSSPGPGKIIDNTVFNTAEEGITASNTANIIAHNSIENNGQACSGCASIISSCQNAQISCADVGTLIQANDILASSIVGPSCSIASGVTFSGASIGNVSRTLTSVTMAVTSNTIGVGVPIVVNGYTSVNQTTGNYAALNGLWLTATGTNGSTIVFNTAQSGTLNAGKSGTPFVTTTGGAAAQQGSSTPSCTGVANNTGGGIPLGIWIHAASSSYNLLKDYTVAGNNFSIAQPQCTISGFDTAANNGNFVYVSSTSNTIVLSNPSGVSDTHAGTVTCANGTLQYSFTLTAAANASGLNTTYTGTGSNISLAVSTGSNAIEYSNTSGTTATLTNVAASNNNIDANWSTPYNLTYTNTTGIVNVLDNGSQTANTLSYNGSGGIAVLSDGTHPGLLQLVGNTTVPSFASNSVALFGPNSASFTKYALQFPSTSPAGSFLSCATPSSNVSACSWATGLSLNNLTGSAANATATEVAAGDYFILAGIETAALTYPYVFTDANSTGNTTSGALIVQTTGTSTAAIPLLINEATAAGSFLNMYSGGTVTGGVLSGGTLDFSFANGGYGQALLGYEGLTAGQSIVFQSGTDGNQNAAFGVLSLRGANETGAGGASTVAGDVALSGGNNSATNTASQAGSVQIGPGVSTGATQGLQGLFLQELAYVKGTTVTQWNLESESAAMTVADAAASPTSILGVAEKVNSTSVLIINDGEAPINASAGVTLGHTVCAGTTASKVTDSGGTNACPPGQITVGTVMATSGTWKLPDSTSITASTTLPIIQLGTLSTAFGGAYNSGSISASVVATNVAAAANFPTGQYLLNCDVVVTAVGTSPTLAVTIGWTDISGTARTKTCTTGVATISDNPVTQAITSNGSAVITVTQTLAVSTATWQTTVSVLRLQ